MEETRNANKVLADDSERQYIVADLAVDERIL
jgi:hypothetical protein